MISYDKLWALLRKRHFQPKDIVRIAGISDSTYRKLLSNDTVRLDVLEKICISLAVDIGDVCSFRKHQR